MTREKEINVAASRYIEENTINGYVAISDHKDSIGSSIIQSSQYL